jgi:hypothetical protein
MRGEDRTDVHLRHPHFRNPLVMSFNTTDCQLCDQLRARVSHIPTYTPRKARSTRPRPPHGPQGSSSSFQDFLQRLKNS